jgi:hypothetical protein
MTAAEVDWADERCTLERVMVLRDWMVVRQWVALVMNIWRM